MHSSSAPRNGIMMVLEVLVVLPFEVLEEWHLDILQEYQRE